MQGVKTVLKMIWKTPNNSPDFFDNVVFGLDWWTDEKNRQITQVPLSV